MSTLLKRRKELLEWLTPTLLVLLALAVQLEMESVFGNRRYLFLYPALRIEAADRGAIMKPRKTIERSR